MSRPDLPLASTLAEVLATQAGIVSAYVFGSMAEGRAHAESDIDLGVLLDRNVTPLPAQRFEVRLRLIGTLESALRRRADVVVLNDAPPQLARRILDGVRIQVTDQEADRAFRRTTASRAADLEPFLRRMRRIKLDAIGR